MGTGTSWHNPRSGSVGACSRSCHGAFPWRATGPSGTGLDNEKERLMAQQAIVGEKVGMTQKWVDDKVVPVTVVRVDPMRIVQIGIPFVEQVDPA